MLAGVRYRRTSVRARRAQSAEIGELQLAIRTAEKSASRADSVRESCVPLFNAWMLSSSRARVISLHIQSQACSHNLGGRFESTG